MRTRVFRLPVDCSDHWATQAFTIPSLHWMVQAFLSQVREIIYNRHLSEIGIVSDATIRWRSVQSRWYRKFQTRKTNQSSVYLPVKGKPASSSGERESWTPVKLSGQSNRPAIERSGFASGHSRKRFFFSTEWFLIYVSKNYSTQRQNSVQDLTLTNRSANTIFSNSNPNSNFHFSPVKSSHFFKIKISLW